MMQPDNNNNNNNNKKDKDKDKEKRPPKPIKKKDFVISAPTNFRSFDDAPPTQPHQPPTQPQISTIVTNAIPPPLPNKDACKLLNKNSQQPINNNNNNEYNDGDGDNNENNNNNKFNDKIYFKVSSELLEDVKKWEMKKIEYSKSIDSLLLKKREQLGQIFNDYLSEMRPILDQHFNSSSSIGGNGSNGDETSFSTWWCEDLKNQILENENQRLKQVQQQLFGSKNASIVTIESQIKEKRREIDMHNKITLIQSIVRGWLAKKKYKTMKSMIQRRQLCLSEIIETERKYVESLSLLIRLFLVPLQTTKKDLLSPIEIQSIFANCSVIYGVHKELLDTLESSLKSSTNGNSNNSSNNGKSVAECFLSLSPFLKLYTQYINNFNNASSTLIECKKRDSKVNQFFFKDNKDNQQLGKRDFLDLQIQPVQRIPRYRLLLTELLSCTPKDHKDYENVKKALAVIQELAMNINESKRTAEGLEKIIFIQSCLTKNIELVKPHRRLIKDGPMLFERRGKLKERYLFLFNDCLLLCKKVSGILSSNFDSNSTLSSSSIGGGSNNNNIGGGVGNNTGHHHNSSIFNTDVRFIPISFMDMNGVIVLPTQDPEIQHGFAVLGNEHLYFYSKNAVEQHEWLLILKEITKELDQNQSTLRKEISELDLKDSMLNPMVKQQDSNRDSLLLATSITNPKRQSKMMEQSIAAASSNQPLVIERHSGSPTSFSPTLNSSIGSNSSNNGSPNQSLSNLSPPPLLPPQLSQTLSPPPFSIPPPQQQLQQPQPFQQPIINNLTIRELIEIFNEINQLQKELVNPSNQFEILFNGQLNQIQMIRQQYPNIESVYNRLTQLLYKLSTLKNQSQALIENQNLMQLLQNVIVQGKDHIGQYNEWIKRTYPMGPSDPSSTQPRFLTINFMKWYNNLHTVWGQVLELKQQQ